MPDTSTTAAPRRKSTHSNRSQRRNPAPAYFGIPDAAAYLGVEHKTVRRLITSGELPAYRLGKRLIKIKVADLDALLTPMRGGAAS
ncbi:helix-turn-helix domain-containing protein [Mycobacterium sp. PSTR-4-N]|uniref:helix-turn-helix domain-containing protein n=1 Tax=Mycobacterium sp. PSTR-4-N TaxID=2917745 RepID=UPI001F1498DB|nr:helix-turn-helix domain-containing protein [Mycobacterium sp. PSTR-4-N]MCG7597842.1 helix-turn-helix domain-containing protein [Mycobacterium sp. PSTR-4-N]